MLIQFQHKRRIEVQLGISIIPCKYEWFRYSQPDCQPMDMSRADFIVVWNDRNHVNHYFPFSSIRCWHEAKVVNALADAHYSMTHNLHSSSELRNYYDYRLGLNYVCQQNDMFFGALKRNMHGKYCALKLNTFDYNDFKRRLSIALDNVGRTTGDIPICKPYEVYQLACIEERIHENSVS